jgi:hypothetical protein
MNAPERFNKAIELGREARKCQKPCFPMEDRFFINLISSQDKRVPFEVLFNAWKTGWHDQYYNELSN